MSTPAIDTQAGKCAATLWVEDIVHLSKVYDGDLVLVVDNKLFLDGIERDCSIVMDIEDKVTSLKEPVNKEHIAQLVLRTLDSSIGECSNCATAYHNKTPKEDGVYEKYQNYINLLSVITGKSINESVDYKFCEPINIGCI